MKIALCIFGQPRYIESEAVYRTQQQAIFNQGDVDVFVHTWFNDTQTHFDQSDWSYSKNLLVNKNAISIINDRYKPCDMIYEPQIKFDISDDTLKIAAERPDSRFNSEKNIFNTKSQLYSIQKSIELCENHITKTNTKYDFIILTRFDVFIHTFPNLQDLEKEKYYVGGFNTVGGYYPGWNDYIQVFDPMFLKANKTYDHYDECLSKCKSLCIEEMKQILLCKYFIFPHVVRYLNEKMCSEIVRDFI